MQFLSRKNRQKQQLWAGWPTLAPPPVLNALHIFNSIKLEKCITCVNALILTALMHLQYFFRRSHSKPTAQKSEEECVWMGVILLSWIWNASWFVFQDYLFNKLNISGLSFTFSCKMCVGKVLKGNQWSGVWWMCLERSPVLPLPKLCCCHSLADLCCSFLIGEPKIKQSGTNITLARWSPLVG